MKTIQAEWDVFKKGIPEDAPDIQRQEMQKAFYAGFLSLLVICVEAGKAEMSDKDFQDQFDGFGKEGMLFAVESILSVFKDA